MESELIRSAQSGDQQAWAALKDSVVAFIQEKISSAVANGMDTEDADGEASLLFVQAVNTFDFAKPCTFLTHLRNTLKALKRSDMGGPVANRGDRGGRVNSHMPEGDSWSGTCDGGQSDIDDADELEAVKENVKKLPANERAVIQGLLAYQTHAELAESLGVSVSTVKKFEARAHKRLRGILK